MNSYNHAAFGQCDIGAPDFWTIAKVGTNTPNFTLTDLEGRRVSLEEFKGKKHVLLEFGSIT
jgi:peroxiredoxin